MIWMFRSDIASAGSCENYEDLFHYIREKEDLKLLKDQSEFENRWSFTIFTPQRASDIYANVKQFQLTEIVKEAYEKELGLIEISRGAPQKRIEILVTPDVDIEALKKQPDYQ